MRTKTCGAEEARATLPDLLEDAHRGQVTLITKRGRPYAALVPAASAQARLRRVSLLSLRGTGAGLWGGDGAAFVARMRDEWE